MALKNSPKYFATQTRKNYNFSFWPQPSALRMRKIVQSLVQWLKSMFFQETSRKLWPIIGKKYDLPKFNFLSDFRIVCIAAVNNSGGSGTRNQRNNRFKQVQQGFFLHFLPNVLLYLIIFSKFCTTLGVLLFEK